LKHSYHPAGDFNPLQKSIDTPNNTTLVDFSNNLAIGLLVMHIGSFLMVE
jgi:hypothetical protein